MIEAMPVNTDLFAEVDQNIRDVKRRALIIWPLVRLSERTHDAVAIRTTVNDATGACN